jgi:hypothetical protein
MSMLHDVLREEFSDRFGVALDALLGEAHAFAQYSPDSFRWAHYNAVGQLSLAARALHGILEDYRPLGFTVADLPPLETRLQAFVDIALAFGAAFARASALYDSREADPERFTALDREAAEALERLENAAREAFAVVES